MANIKISQLPSVQPSGYTNDDLLVIVNYDVSSGTTKNTPLSGLTSYILSGLTFQADYLPLSGGTVTGDTIFSSGLTATTISASIYLGLPLDVYVTGGTYSAGTITFTNNSGGTFPVSGITSNAGNQWLIPTGDTVTVNSNYQYFIYGDIIVQGTLILEPNSELVVINGDVINSGGTITNNGTISNIEIPLFDTKVTGGTYSAGTITFTNNSGGTFTVTGITSTFTGNTSATCITDLYVTNLNSCSPLHIQPTNVGDVYIGEGGGVNVGIGTSTPNYLLDVNGVINANTIQTNILSVTTSISGDGSLLNNIPTSSVVNLDTQLFNFNTHISDLNNPHQTSLGNLFGGSAHTHTISEITDFGSYSASTYSLITAHTLNFNNPHQTSLGNLFGGSAHTHTISEIIDLTNQLNSKIGSTGGTITGSLIVQQNFTVLGTATTINTETLSIENNLITLNSNLTGATDQPFFGKSGIEILRGSATTSTLVWDESNDYWVAGLTGNTKQIVLSGDSLSLLNSGHTHPISEIIDLQTNLNNKFDKTGGTISGSVSATTISATTFYGDGSNLTGLITTDYYVTGGTFSGSTLTLRRNGLPDVPITGFTSTGDYLSLSGGTVTGNTTFTTGLTLTNLTGTTDRIVEVDVSGNVSAERRIISAYITGSTEISLLDNLSNWSSGVYVGTAITGTYQGQKHYNSNYFFEAVADNVWIRLSRV